MWLQNKWQPHVIKRRHCDQTHVNVITVTIQFKCDPKLTCKYFSTQTAAVTPVSTSCYSPCLDNLFLTGLGPSSCLHPSPHPRGAPVWYQTRRRAAVLTRSFVFWPPWHMERAGTAQMSAKCWWREWEMDGPGLRGSLPYCPVPGTAPAC